MTTVGAAPKPELTTLTLDHIVSDLESLSSNHGIFSLASTSTSSASTGPTSRTDLLRSFETGSTPSSRKEYVELSHELMASHRNAQRLNSERVSAAEVGLVLPSERSRASTSSSSSRTGGSATGGRGAAEKATRTDLLHAKVADLQTQVDAWDTALRQAVRLVDDPQQSIEERTAATPNVDASNGSSVSGTSVSDPLADAASPSVPMELSAEPPAEEYEDDDPWNDLS